MAKKRYYEPRERLEKNDLYAGMADRKRLEAQDGGTIFEDHSQVANLPQEVIMRAYPKPAGYMPDNLDDTIRGIDRQMEMDNRKKLAHLQPEKY